MKIESLGSLPNPFRQRQVDAEQDVQNVFSSILEAAGRQGYASAETIDLSGEEGTSISVDTQILDSLNSWFQVESEEGRYASSSNVKELSQRFGELLVRANEEGAYLDPKEFLRSLSGDELEVLQHVHSLADPIAVGSLTEEGALNLLLPPAAQVDLNGDGLTTSGIGQSIRFPNSSTPNEVADAWYEATASMEFSERMIYELQMMLPVITSNIVFDENGAFSHVAEPGDTDYKNPMLNIDYSYSEAAQARLDYLEAFKNQIDPIQHQQGTQFWEEFKQFLESSDR